MIAQVNNIVMANDFVNGYQETLSIIQNQS